jgi:hypothetical protein
VPADASRAAVGDVAGLRVPAGSLAFPFPFPVVSSPFFDPAMSFVLALRFALSFCGGW